MKSDQQLLQEYIKQGSQDAFREIVSQHGKMVYSACYRIFQDAHLAEDATQEVFLVLMKKASTLKPEITLGGWLYNRAIWTAKNMNRSRISTSKRERRSGMETENMTISGEESLWKEISPYLDDALATLPKKLNEAILLCFLQEKSRSEAAQILGCSEKALSKRIGRALETLSLALSRKGIAAPVATLTAVLATSVTELKAASVASTLSQSITVSKALTAAQAGATYATTAFTMKAIIITTMAAGVIIGLKLYNSPDNTSPIQAVIHASHPLQQLADKLGTENKLLKLEIESEKQSYIQTPAEADKTALFTNRYHRLLKHINKDDIWKLKFNNSHSDGDMLPTKELIEFLALNEEQVQELEQVCKKILNEIIEFERQHATLYEKTDKIISYDIPKMPEEYRTSFAESIKAIISEDDHSLISHLAMRDIEHYTDKKYITIRLTAIDHGRKSTRTLYTTRYTMGSERGSNRWKHDMGDIAGGYDIYIGKRWGHLFNSDDFQLYP